MKEVPVITRARAAISICLMIKLKSTKKKKARVAVKVLTEIAIIVPKRKGKVGKVLNMKIKMTARETKT